MAVGVRAEHLPEVEDPGMPCSPEEDRIDSQYLELYTHAHTHTHPNPYPRAQYLE